MPPRDQLQATSSTTCSSTWLSHQTVPDTNIDRADSTCSVPFSVLAALLLLLCCCCFCRKRSKPKKQQRQQQFIAEEPKGPPIPGGGARTFRDTGYQAPAAVLATANTVRRWP